MKAERGNAITVRFALPSEALRPYVTTYYLIEAQTSAAEPVIEDYLHPEWPNLRFLKPGWSTAAIGSDPARETPAFAVTGPTTKATRFRIGDGHSAVQGGNWGIGLMPLGWAKFVGAPAGDYADRFVDGDEDPAFEALRALAPKLSGRFSGESADFAGEVAAIEGQVASLRRQLENTNTIISIDN